jgi:hypothetical protein
MLNIDTKFAGLFQILYLLEYLLNKNIRST